MANEKERVSTEELETLPQDWFDRANEAADRHDIPVPDPSSAADAEEALNRFEQRGGE